MIPALVGYPLITIVTATAVYLGTEKYGEADFDFRSASKREGKTFLICMATILSLFPVISHFYGLYPVFILFVGVSAVFVVAIIRYPPIIVGPLLIINLILSRGVVWSSAPLLGHDPRLHWAITEYVVKTGQIIPESYWYYTWYPITHVYGAIGTEVLGLTTKEGYFIILISAVSISLIYVYLFSRATTSITSSIPGLFGILSVIVAVWHFNRTAVPFTQTLGAVYVFSILYISLRSTDKRWSGAAILILVSALFTHNTVAIVLGILGGIFVVVNYGLNSLKSKLATVPESISERKPGITLIILLGITVVATLQIWWMTVSGFFELQVIRFLRIFSAGSGASQQVSASNFANMTVEVLGLDIRVLLLYAIPLLISGFYITIAGLEALNTTIRKPPVFSRMWAFAICGFFGLVGIAFVTGAESHITRLFDISMLMIAPVAGFVGYKIYSTGKPGVIILIVLIALAPTVSLIGMQHNLPISFVPPTESGAPSYPSYHSESEVASINHVIDYHDRVSTDGYTRVSGWSLEMARADRTVTFEMYVEKQDLDTGTLQSFAEESSGSHFLYRTMYREYSDTTIPPCYGVLYDSGGAKVLRSC